MDYQLLRRWKKNKVLPLSAVYNKMKIHETVVSIDPVLIFQRICFLKHSVEDLIRFFSYELAPFPMSIFDLMWLRKTAKSALFAIFKEQKYEDFDRTNSTIVIDGGMLLHRFLWPRGNTFDSVASAYATFVQKSWGNRVHVVFDGYSVMSTKGSEQDRRKQKKGCIDYEFTPSMVPQISQDTFLTSSKNKTQLIALLCEHFDRHDISWTRCESDADTEIVRTAIQKSSQSDKVIIICEDTDVLVILTALAPNDKEIFFIKPPRGKTNAKLYSSRSLNNHPVMKSNILFIHAMSGCDTTSAFYRKGKKNWQI